MGRRKRLIIPGIPHHVTARGNQKRKTFHDAEDYVTYLSMFKKLSDRYQTPIYAHCPMPNHMHTIAVPSEREALSLLFHDLQGEYARYFNKKYGYCGHLWQQRFFSCALDDLHLWNAIRYVEQNPVRAKLVDVAEDYPWSSAAAHCGLKSDPILSSQFPPPGLVSDWSDWLKGELSQEELAAIRIATQKGIPYASEAFIQELEALLGIRIRPLRTRKMVIEAPRP